VNLKDGEFAVRLARRAVEEWATKGDRIARPKCGRAFLVKSGVFVTLHTYPGRDLRGCIGFPYPYLPLADAIIEAAMSAAQDPRFPPFDRSELDKTIVEVSVLTPPEKIVAKTAEEYPKKIKIGRDGLIIKKGMHSGLLLPQVATEYGWDAKTFLEHLCDKAFLGRDAWFSKDAQLFCFRSAIFSEKKPRGQIERM
jgi:uncharacterized protein (TIGR00296 family)